MESKADDIVGSGFFQLSTGSGFELWENDGWGCMMEVIDLTFGIFPIPDQCTSIASNAQYGNCTRIHHEPYSHTSPIRAWKIFDLLDLLLRQRMKLMQCKLILLKFTHFLRIFCTQVCELMSSTELSIPHKRVLIL